MKDSIVPYVIIKSLGCIENIFEMRLFGMIIAKAQAVQKRYNKNLDAINLQHAMGLVRVTLPGRYLLQDGDNNYRNIKKAFTLANKSIEYDYNGATYKLNLIAFPEYHKKKWVGGEVTFVIHDHLWIALLDFSQGHRLIELPVYLRLKSTYSVILYMLMSNQKKPLTYTMEHLKQLLGCDTQKAYTRNNNFINKVLEPARRELDERSPVTFHYSLNREGRGGAYKTCTLIPWQSEHYKPAPTNERKEKDLDRQRVRLSDNVSFYLQESFGMDVKTMEHWEEQITTIGTEERQMSFLADMKERCIRRGVRNRAGYLVRALQNRF